MVDKKTYAKWGTVGGILLILIFGGINLTMTDYRDVLNDNTDYDLIMLLNTSKNIEMVGRSDNPDIEFTRWNFRENYVKFYHARNLKVTSYWQVFDGSRGVWFNEKEVPVAILNQQPDEAKIEYNIKYYTDSRHTNYVGDFKRTVGVYPNMNKENIVFDPVDETKRYNLKWITEINKYEGESRNFKSEGVCKFEYDNVKINWCDSVDLISSARVYKSSGRLVIRYKSVVGEQVIDPYILTGKVPQKPDTMFSNKVKEILPLIDEEGGELDLKTVNQNYVEYVYSGNRKGLIADGKYKIYKTDDGQWDIIDETVMLSNKQDYNYEISKGLYEVYFKNDITETSSQLIKLNDYELYSNLESVGFTLGVGQIVNRLKINPDSIITKDNMVTYENVVDGVDFVFNYNKNELKEYVNINEKLNTNENFFVYSGVISFSPNLVPYSQGVQILENDVIPSNMPIEMYGGDKRQFMIEAPYMITEDGITKDCIFHPYYNDVLLKYDIYCDAKFINDNIPVAIDPTLYVDGSTESLGGNLTYDLVRVRNGGVIQIDTTNKSLFLNATKFIVVGDGSIDGIGRGSSGGAAGGAGGGDSGGTGGTSCFSQGGTGGAGGTQGLAGRGGGGAGGGMTGAGGNGAAALGGAASIGGTAAAAIYKTNENFPCGSGGGGGASYSGHGTGGGTGGSGGAGLRLESWNVTVQGSLNMTGSSGGTGFVGPGCAGGDFDGGGGGGSGGTVLIYANNMDIDTATIKTNAGAGGGARDDAGGGGGGSGGHQKFFSNQTINSTVTHTVTAGSGGGSCDSPGSAGATGGVYYEAITGWDQPVDTPATTPDQIWAGQTNWTDGRAYLNDTFYRWVNLSTNSTTAVDEQDYYYIEGYVQNGSGDYNWITIDNHTQGGSIIFNFTDYATWTNILIPQTNASFRANSTLTYLENTTHSDYYWELSNITLRNNSAPQFTAIPHQYVEMNYTQNFTLNMSDYTSDAEDDILTYYFISQTYPTLIDCDLADETNISCSYPTTNWLGTSHITFNFTDNQTKDPLSQNWNETSFFLTVNSSATETTVYLDDVSADRKYEYQTTANISANTSCANCEVCINFDAPNYGDNYSCGTHETSFQYPVGAYSEDDFTYANTTYNSTFNTTLQPREIFNATIAIQGNVSGAGYPYYTNIDMLQNGSADIILPGYLEGTQLRENTTNLNKTNVTMLYETGGSNVLFINFTANDMIGTNEDGLQYVSLMNFTLEGLNDNSEEINVDEDFKYLSTNSTINTTGVQQPMWMYEDMTEPPTGEVSGRWTFTSSSATTGCAGATASCTGPTYSFNNYVQGTCAGTGSQYPAITCSQALAQSCSASGSGILYNQDLDLDEYKSTVVNWTYIISGFSPGNGCSGTGIYGIGIYDIDFGTYTQLSGGSTSSSTTTSTNIHEFRRVGDKIKLYFPAGSSTVIGETDIDDSHQYGIAFRSAFSSDHYSISGTTQVHNVNVSGIELNRTNSSSVYDTAGQYEGNYVANFSSNLIYAKLTADDVEPSSTAIEYFMSNDNGTTYEPVTSGLTHVFTSTGQNLTWWANLTTSDTDNSPRIKSVNFEVTQGNPSDIGIDVGNDGTEDTSVISTELNQTNSPLETSANVSAIQDYIIGNCQDDLVCVVPFAFTSDTAGALRISNITALTQIDAVRFDNDLLTTNLSGCVGATCNIFANMYDVDQSQGLVDVLNVSFIYVRDTNFTAFAHFDGLNGTSLSNDSHVLQVRYSPFNLTIFPNLTSNIYWTATNFTENNITPLGQEINYCNVNKKSQGYCENVSIPIWNITSLALTDSMDVYLGLNESINSCANITISSNITKGDGTTVNVTRQVVFDDMTVGGGDNFWLWLDLYDCNNSIRYFDPLFNFDSVCSDCVITSDF